MYNTVQYIADLKYVLTLPKKGHDQGKSAEL